LVGGFCCQFRLFDGGGEDSADDVEEPVGVVRESVVAQLQGVEADQSLQFGRKFLPAERGGPID
jgi:hypothetical protein